MFYFKQINKKYEVKNPELDKNNWEVQYFLQL